MTSDTLMTRSDTHDFIVFCEKKDDRYKSICSWRAIVLGDSASLDIKAPLLTPSIVYITQYRYSI